MKVNRLAHKAVACLCGYFWLPCDECGSYFGGHESGWKARTAGVPGDSLLCPECAAGGGPAGESPDKDQPDGSTK